MFPRNKRSQYRIHLVLAVGLHTAIGRASDNDEHNGDDDDHNHGPHQVGLHDVDQKRAAVLGLGLQALVTSGELALVATAGGGVLVLDPGGVVPGLETLQNGAIQTLEELAVRVRVLRMSNTNKPEPSSRERRARRR